MRECNNSKIHISSNFLLSKSLIIMSDTLLFVPSLHCNISAKRGHRKFWVNPSTAERTDCEVLGNEL